MDDRYAAIGRGNMPCLLLDFARVPIRRRCRIRTMPDRDPRDATKRPVARGYALIYCNYGYFVRRINSIAGATQESIAPYPDRPIDVKRRRSRKVREYAMPTSFETIECADAQTAKKAWTTPGLILSEAADAEGAGVPGAEALGATQSS